MRKALFLAIAGTTLALGGGSALAAVDCSTITTIGAWKTAGTCSQGDKDWAISATSTNLLDSTQVLFGGALLTHNMQIVGFDTTNDAATWSIDYTITVTLPASFFISDMFAGADNPGGGSLLTKDVTGDPSGPFTLTDTDGAEGPAAEKHGLTATSLSIHEVFSVGAGKNLLSVSNTYIETSRAPVPGTLALLGLGLVALGAMRRKGSAS